MKKSAHARTGSYPQEAEMKKDIQEVIDRAIEIIAVPEFTEECATEILRTMYNLRGSLDNLMEWVAKREKDAAMPSVKKTQPGATEKVVAR